MRIMLDTNILISAFIFKSKTLNNFIDNISKKHEVIICTYTIEEIEGLMHTKFNRTMNEVNNFLNTFPYELVYSPKEVEKRLFEIRDEYDYIILHTAILSNVDILVTGDKDFNDVKIGKPKIMTVRQYINKYM